MLGRAEGAGQPHAPAARQAERGQHRLEDRLVAERDCRARWPGSVSASSACASASERASARARVGVAEILDAGLEELVAALAALAEHLAEIGVAARRAGLAGDVVEADGNGEFRAQAERLAGLALGEEDAAAQILAGHVEKRIGRLEDRHVDGMRRRARRRASGCRARWRDSGRSWRASASVPLDGRPSACRPSPPQGGRSAASRAQSAALQIGEARRADLPACGGDRRQAKGGGRTRAYVTCALRLLRLEDPAHRRRPDRPPAPSPAPGGFRASRRCR